MNKAAHIGGPTSSRELHQVAFQTGLKLTFEVEYRQEDALDALFCGELSQAKKPKNAGLTGVLIFVLTIVWDTPGKFFGNYNKQVAKIGRKRGLKPLCH